MWLPRWLGEAYARLYDSVGEETFSLLDAQKILAFGEGKLRAAFSALHRRRVLHIFAQTRPRRYRLLTPAHFLLLGTEMVSNVELIRQEQYLKLVLDVFEVCRTDLQIISFGVYGSVARGTATATSDLDVLIVSRDFQGGFGRRLDEMVALRRGKIDGEIGWLWKHGVYATLSFYPLRPEETEQLPLLLADLTEEAVILYDPDRLLERVLAKMRAKILESGARRVWLDRNRWYWDLKPKMKLRGLTAT